MNNKGKIDIDYTIVENILHKVEDKQPITKIEYLDIARMFSRLYSIYMNRPNSDYVVQVVMMNSILQDAANLCVEKPPNFTMSDIMDFFIAQ